MDAVESAKYGYQPNRVTTNTIAKSKDSSQLGMEDFLQLMVAQMQNQDMLNPMDDTQFIASMAQFSALQGINVIQQYQLSSYATSYVGKYVLIAESNSSGGLDKITGKVDSVSFYNGEPTVFVNGKEYPLYTIMQVSNDPIELETEASDKNNGEPGTSEESGASSESNAAGKADRSVSLNPNTAGDDVQTTEV